MSVDPSVAALAVVQTWCRWHIGPPQVDVQVTLDGSGNWLQFLPSLKVTAVTSVVDDGTTLVEGTDYLWSTYGWLERVGCTPFSWKPRSVVVTMTHGYDALPDDVQAVVDRLASRGSADAGALRQVGQVQYATTSDGVGVGGSLTAADKAQLMPYRIPLGR